MKRSRRGEVLGAKAVAPAVGGEGRVQSKALRSRARGRKGILALQRIGLTVVFGLVGVLFASLLFEGLARIVWPYGLTDRGQEMALGREIARVTTSDPTTGWKGRPYVDTTFATAAFQHSVRHNSLGFRDQERKPTTSDEALRVLVLGDSFTWGWGVKEEEIYVRVLESVLREDASAVEVINVSFLAWATDQEYLAYRAWGKAYQPDLVLLQFFPNDLPANVEITPAGKKPLMFSLDEAGALFSYQVPREESAPLRASVATRVKIWLNQRSYTYRLLASTADRYPWVRESLATFGLVSDPPPEAPSPEETAALYDRGVKITRALVAALREEVSAEGARFLMVYVPSRAELSVLSGKGRSSQSVEEIERAKESLNLGQLLPRGEFLDLTPLFQGAEEGASTLYTAQDVVADAHWTPAGHRLAAEAIEAHMRSYFSDFLRAR